MSIATEISRIQQAKADIKSAIEDKGVTVPSNATLDDYSDYIDAIQTGGGGGSSVTTFYTGSLTRPGAKGGGGPSGPPGPMETNIPLYISYPNNNDKVPDMFIVYDENKSLSLGLLSYMILTSSRSIYNTDYSSASVGHNISLTSATSTLAIVNYFYPYPNQTVDPTKFQFAPIYLS